MELIKVEPSYAQVMCFLVFHDPLEFFEKIFFDDNEFTLTCRAKNKIQNCSMYPHACQDAEMFKYLSK